MNEDNIAALDQSIGRDGSCWLATLPVPMTCGEYNLFACEPVLFRKKKGQVAENEEGGYSRQQTRAGHTNSYLVTGFRSFMNGQMSDNYYNCGHGK
jgi:hypothetical protein